MISEGPRGPWRPCPLVVSASSAEIPRAPSGRPSSANACDSNKCIATLQAVCSGLQLPARTLRGVTAPPDHPPKVPPARA
eukprot:6573453-Alexandrium_andersonii.AAC.1